MAEIPNAELLRCTLTGKLETDEQRLRTILNLPENEDIIVRPFEAGGFALRVIYTEGMAGTTRLPILSCAPAAPSMRRGPKRPRRSALNACSIALWTFPRRASKTASALWWSKFLAA